MRKSLVVLAACLVLLVACPGCGKETTFTINGEMGLSAAITLTENHIQSLVNSMQVLAITDEVKAGNWTGMWGLLNKFSEDQVPAAVWYALPNGTYYTVEKGEMNVTLSDRAYFPKVMAGNITVGDLVESKSTGRKSVIAAVPVKNGGNVTGALGVSVYLDNLSQILVSELQLPDNMVFYAVNEDGYIALHSDTQWLMEKAADMGSETFSEAVVEMLLNKEGTVKYEFEGMKETVVYQTSPLTNWCFALGIRTK